jgi:hypothetical protein
VSVRSSEVVEFIAGNEGLARRISTSDLTVHEIAMDMKSYMLNLIGSS